MTMTLVETVTVGSGGAASIEFTSIPQDGVDLLILVSGRTNDVINGARNIRFNNLNDFVYSQIELNGDGSSATSTSQTNNRLGLIQINAPSSATANTFGNAQIYVSNYTSSSAKSISIDTVNENNGTAARQQLAACLFNSTAAITSVQLLSPYAAPFGNFVEHSTASLYIIS